MFFYEFEKYKDAKLDKRLLWEFEVDKDFDYNSVKRLVVQRVIQLGSKEDYYAIFKMFGGIDGVNKIIKYIVKMRLEKFWAWKGDGVCFHSTKGW